MALVEYGGGSKHSFIFITKEEGQGWRRLAGALWAAVIEGRGISQNKGGTTMRQVVVVVQPKKHLYREVLEMKKPHERV